MEHGFDTALRRMGKQHSASIYFLATLLPPGETGTDNTNGGRRRRAGFRTGTRLECDIWLAAWGWSVRWTALTLPEWRHHGLKKERERERERWEIKVRRADGGDKKCAAGGS